jgi:hypothetical protein
MMADHEHYAASTLRGRLTFRPQFVIRLSFTTRKVAEALALPYAGLTNMGLRQKRGQIAVESNPNKLWQDFVKNNSYHNDPELFEAYWQLGFTDLMPRQFEEILNNGQKNIAIMAI